MKNIKLERLYKTVLLVVSLVVATNLYAQSGSNVYNYENSIGVGLTTSKVLGDNPAINTISPINNSVPGGSFNGAMPGIEIKAQYKLDDIGDWRLVGGINYTFYSARERIPRESITFRLKNNLNILSPLVGINYVLIRFPSAMSSVYIGAEARYNYIHANDFVLEEERLTSGERVERQQNNKEATGRIGGLLKLGFEGELHENYMINVSGGIDFLNLIGRDNSRGELLTPFTPDRFDPNLGVEQEEQLTYNFYFSIMIQYRY